MTDIDGKTCRRAPLTDQAKEATCQFLQLAAVSSCTSLFSACNSRGGSFFLFQLNRRSPLLFGTGGVHFSNRA